MFDKYWFLKYQKYLLKFANTFLGRYILRIQGKRSSVGRNKIIRILPNSITWKEGKYFKAEFRTHDKFSKRIYYAFKPIWNLFHLWDMAWYPNFNLGFDTLGPLYPAVGANSPVDGDVGRNSVDDVFAAIRNGAGNFTDGGTASAVNIFIGASTTSNRYSSMYRTITLFNTSALTGGASVSAATYSLFSRAKTNGLGSLNVSMVNSNPASNSVLANSDYGNVGTTRQATDITYASWQAADAGYNDWTLNATGLASISKTGISKFGARIANDLDDSAPVWSSGASSDMGVYAADETGTTRDPKLVVTFTLSSGFFALL